VGELSSADTSDFLWLHFNLSQAGTEKWLREHIPLPVEFFEALQQGSRSTRVELVDDSLLAVVNDVLHGFAFNPDETSTLWLSVTPHLVISAPQATEVSGSVASGRAGGGASGDLGGIADPSSA
jgi:zinc transporter